jgi:flagellar basal body-associated protein FliL
MTFDAGYENRIFPITLIVIVLVLVLGGGFGYWYYASQKLNHIAKDAPLDSRVPLEDLFQGLLVGGDLLLVTRIEQS